jgi:Sec-independent protein secretion pathway component TatC
LLKLSSKSKKSDLTENDNEAEMTFLEHLEELRWRLIYSFIGVLIGTIISGIFIDFLVEAVLLRPAIENKVALQNLKPFGQIFLYLQISIIGGIILSLPNLFYQLWKFIAPALRKNERKHILAILICSSSIGIL